MRDNLAVEITDLDLVINKLCNQLAPLIKTRHRKYTEFEKCEAVLSPLRRLPPEIIREIFTYLYDPSPSDPRVESHHLRRPRLQDMPWVVSWVCRLWRSVALDLSCMWTNIRVGTVRQPFMHPRLCTLIERAREQRLSVSFARGWAYPDLHSLETILSTCYRWRYLHLDRNFDFIAPVRGKLQSLEVLQLDITGIIFNQEESPLVNEGVPNGLESLPSLHTVITWPEVCLMASWLPRFKITYLNLAEGPVVISSTQLRKILSTFPNIKHLNTKAPSSGGGSSDPTLNSPLEYKSLETLTIHIERKWRTKHPNYLSKITFPSLRSIRIRQTLEESTKAIQCLAQLLKDSQCPIEDITWWLDDSDPEPTAPQFRFTSQHYLPLFRSIDWESVHNLTITAPNDGEQLLYDALCNRFSKTAFSIGRPTFLFSELKNLNLIAPSRRRVDGSDAFKRLREWRSELWIGVFSDWEDWEPANCWRVYPSEPRVEYDWRDFICRTNVM